MIRSFSGRSTGGFLLLVMLFASSSSLAQQTHHYAISSGQPPALVADAGKDVHITGDEPVDLGGASPATGGTDPYTYSWTPATNLSDPEIATPTVTAASGDITYTLTVTDDAGCKATDDVTVFAEIITSVLSKKEIPFAIHPSGEGITIRSSLRDASIHMFDMRGATVLTDRITSREHHLDTSNLPAGIYVLRISVGRDTHIVKLFIP